MKQVCSIALIIQECHKNKSANANQTICMHEETSSNVLSQGEIQLNIFTSPNCTLKERYKPTNATQQQHFQKALKPQIDYRSDD